MAEPLGSQTICCEVDVKIAVSTIVMIYALIAGCSIFGSKDGGSSSGSMLSNDFLNGHWHLVAESNLDGSNRVDVSGAKTVIMTFRDGEFSQFHFEKRQYRCVESQASRTDTARIFVDRKDSCDGLTLFVKELEADLMSLQVESTLSATDHQQSLGYYRRIPTADLKNLLASGNFTKAEVPSLLSDLVDSGNGADVNGSVFQPDIDLGGDKPTLVFTNDFVVEENSVEVILAAGLQFVIENGQSYKQGSNPGVSLYCDVTVVNVGNVQRQGGDYLFPSGLNYKSLRTTDARSGSGFATKNILLEGMELDCTDPSSADTISFTKLSTSLGASIDLR